MFLPAITHYGFISIFPLQCSVSSSEEERLTSTRRPKTPTSSDCSDLHTQTNWTKSLPLPTPEEKMRQQAQTVQADVVPINITGMLCSVDRLQIFWKNDYGSLFGICSQHVIHTTEVDSCGLTSCSLLNEGNTKMYMCVHVKYLFLLDLQTVSPKVDVREFSGPAIQLKGGIFTHNSILLIELPF